MPLARIISRTPQCWQALAVELLARGYAVEIVSPDAIPDNFADLELRVDTDGLNDLIASITAHDSGHSSSLDFVHHLRAPMEDFVRRPPKVGDIPAYSSNPTNLNAEQKLSDEIELPAETAAPPPAPVDGRMPDVEAVEEGARLISLPRAQNEVPVVSSPEEAPPPVQEPRKQPKAGITIVFHRSQSEQKAKRKTFKRSGRWFLRTSAGFVAVVALGIVLVRGIRGKDSLVENVSADSPRVVSVDATSSQAAANAQPEATPPENSTAGVTGEARPSHRTSKKSHSSKANPREEITTRRTNDLPLEEAAVYRDKPPAKTASHARRAKRHQRRDDMVAEDTVIYLDKKAAPNNRMR